MLLVTRRYKYRGEAFLGTTEIGVSLSHHLQQYGRGENWVYVFKFFWTTDRQFICFLLVGSTIDMFFEIVAQGSI